MALQIAPSAGRGATTGAPRRDQRQTQEQIGHHQDNQQRPAEIADDAGQHQEGRDRDGATASQLSRSKSGHAAPSRRAPRAWANMKLIITSSDSWR
jgi:hypothetical protein